MDFLGPLPPLELGEMLAKASAVVSLVVLVILLVKRVKRGSASGAASGAACAAGLPVRDLQKRPLALATDIIFGTSPLGGIGAEMSDDEAEEVVEHAVVVGFRMFDTAPHYGCGAAEVRLGNGLRNGCSAVCRTRKLAAALLAEQIIVWTKVGRLVKAAEEITAADAVEHDNAPGSATTIYHDSPVGVLPVLDYTAAGARQSFEDSCARLGAGVVVTGLRCHDPETAAREQAATAPKGSIVGLATLRDERFAATIGAAPEAPAAAEALVEAAADEAPKSIRQSSRLKGEAAPTPKQAPPSAKKAPQSAKTPVKTPAKAPAKTPRTPGVAAPALPPLEISLGLNNASAALRILELTNPADANSNMRLDSVMLAGRWNLLDQSGAGVLAVCAARGVKVHVAGVFASGLLAGGETCEYAAATSTQKAKAAQWAKLAQGYDCDVKAVAVAFALLPQCVDKVAVGLGTVEEVDAMVQLVGGAANVPAALWREAVKLKLLAPSLLAF
ncbi:hypothetical protein M885DRAFT_614407 [Pelagophyceae sp. CCMP2097]|nr:hypothetical protein M885DRAFT_614407 [Pelagophyceae sp. CCMP2097]|mmetsp:Transcript_24872/g.83556  ORF Transcript_24872/g.83556 Transcript_24872/m.83556 type:complete len:501 (-) Transcript_24872:217-1719(-)